MLGQAMIESFVVSIREAVERGAPLEETVGILRMWCERGLTAEDASRALGRLREGVDERFEDRVLEIMDVASGFCRPELRVWDP